MTGPRPVAEIEPAFTPSHIWWGRDDQLIAAEVGSTHPVTSFSISERGVDVAWRDEPDELAGGTLTAVAVSRRLSTVAVAETITIPHDPEPFHRLRILNLVDGTCLPLGGDSGIPCWVRNYTGADDLLFSGAGTGVLLARTGHTVTGYDVSDPGRPSSGPIYVGSSGPWRAGPEPDGARVAIGSRLIDVAGFSEAWSAPGFGLSDSLGWAGTDTIVATGVTGPIYECVPGPDGSLVYDLAAAGQGFVKAFEADSGTVRARWWGQTAGAGALPGIGDVAVSPDNRLVAYAFGDELVVLALPDLEPVANVPSTRLGGDTAGRRRKVRFSPDGSIVAVNASRTGPGVALVDAASGTGLFQRSWDDTDHVAHIEFSPSGRLLAIGDGRRIRCYEVADLTRDTWVHHRHWTMDGVPDHIAMATYRLEDGTERTLLGAVGRHHRGQILEYFRYLDRDEPEVDSNPWGTAMGLTISPDRHHYAVWRQDGDKTLRYRTITHDTDSEKSWPRARAGGEAAFLTDTVIVAVEGDPKLRFYDVEQSHPAEVRMGNPVGKLRVSPGPSLPAWAGLPRLIAVAGGNDVWVVDAQSRSPIRTEPITVGGRVEDLTFAPETPLLVVAHGDRMVTIIDPTTATVTTEIPLGGPARRAVVSRRQSLLATFESTGNVVRITPLQPEAVETDCNIPGQGYVLSSFRAPVKDMAFYPMGKALAVATEGVGAQQPPFLHLFDVCSGDEIWWMPLEAAVHQIAFTESGDLLAAACDDGVHLYRTRAG